MPWPGTSSARRRISTRSGTAWSGCATRIATRVPAAAPAPLRDGAVADDTNQGYGLAFVLLACACARKAGFAQAQAWMDETWDLLEARFWDPGAGLYADEADAAWPLGDDRGQNANMHLCEAMLWPPTRRTAGGAGWIAPCCWPTA